MFKNFKLAHYRFTLIPHNIIQMPTYNKGNILRGAFGSSLKRLVCINKNFKCNDCGLKEKCAYVLIFNPVGISPVKRLYNVPRGYVLKPPLEKEKVYSSEKPFSFETVLLGDRINYLPYVIVALIELGKFGIGLNRGMFTLKDLSILKDNISESIYDPDTNTVKNIQKIITEDEILAHAEKINRNVITLCFLTPTRIRFNPTGEKGKSEVVRAPRFHHIIRRLRDRINALSVTYCGKPVDIDFKGIAEKAMLVKTKEVNLRWIDIKRKSRTQPIYHDQSGFIGKITFKGDLREFLPLLLFGEYVHVGEDAVFGNGWYRIEHS